MKYIVAVDMDDIIFCQLQRAGVADVGGDHGHVDLQRDGLRGGEGCDWNNDGLHANSKLQSYKDDILTYMVNP